MPAPVQTLADLAFRVHRLLRKFGPEPFEQMLLAWAAETNKPTAEFEKARKKHLLRALSDIRLRDEAAGPPGPGWEWRNIDQVEVAGKMQYQPAWFPPELRCENRPKPEYPLPVPDDRALTLPEKYAALLAIHILHAKGAKIKPWRPLPPPASDEHYWESRFLPADCADSFHGRLLFDSLLENASKTPEKDVRWLRDSLSDVAADLKGRAKPSTPAPAPGTKRKRSTAKGDAEKKLIAALTAHHKYENGGCSNFEPVGVNELARNASGQQEKVSSGSASAFFKKQFESHDRYKALCNKDSSELAFAIKLMNGEVLPKALLSYGRNPPGETPCARRRIAGGAFDRSA